MGKKTKVKAPDDDPHANETHVSHVRNTQSHVITVNSNHYLPIHSFIANWPPVGEKLPWQWSSRVASALISLFYISFLFWRYVRNVC
jgi:hypothetical protein